MPAKEWKEEDDMRFFKKRKSILPPAAEHIEANLANSVIYVKDLQKMYFTARALANSPEVLLMDEPFSALDAQTKADMQLLMRQIWQVEKPTVMFVTHDIEEAVFLSSKIYVLTARPGTVKAEVPVYLPYDRTLKLKDTDEFFSIRKSVSALIEHASFAEEQA